MNMITLQDIKSHGAKAIPDTGTTYLIVNSQTKSVLVPPDEYAMLIAAQEELEDIRAIESRKHEKPIPYSKVFPKRK